MTYRFTKLSMLLLAASIVLFPDIRGAAKAARPLPDAVQTILAAAAADADAKTAQTAEKDTVRDVNGDGRVTAADAGMLLLYENGMLCSLPENGATQAVAEDAVASAATRYLAMRIRFSFETAKEMLTTDRLSVYGRLAENREAFLLMTEEAERAAHEAVIAYMPVMSAMLRKANMPLYPFEGVENVPDWKSMAALYRAFGSETEQVLLSALQCTLVPQGNGVRVSLRFLTHDEIAALGDRAQLLAAKFAYAYLNTVFDERGEALQPTHDVFDEAYLSTVAHPLPGCTIKNGWRDPRDNGTRLHMGTDILASRRTPIHAATGGTVLYIGFSRVPGNYVVIRDAYGYEYHYYHMFQKSRQVMEGDTVEQGDVIGLVGNTGNSAANHLHLAIIAPDYRYVNPYDLYVQAGARPIRPDDGSRYTAETDAPKEE